MTLVRVTPEPPSVNRSPLDEWAEMACARYRHVVEPDGKVTVAMPAVLVPDAVAWRRVELAALPSGFDVSRLAELASVWALIPGEFASAVTAAVALADRT